MQHTIYLALILGFLSLHTTYGSETNHKEHSLDLTNQNKIFTPRGTQVQGLLFWMQKVYPLNQNHPKIKITANFDATTFMHEPTLNYNFKHVQPNFSLKISKKERLMLPSVEFKKKDFSHNWNTKVECQVRTARKLEIYGLYTLNQQLVKIFLQKNDTKELGMAYTFTDFEEMERNDLYVYDDRTKNSHLYTICPCDKNLKFFFNPKYDITFENYSPLFEEIVDEFRQIKNICIQLKDSDFLRLLRHVHSVVVVDLEQKYIDALKELLPLELGKIVYDYLYLWKYIPHFLFFHNDDFREDYYSTIQVDRLSETTTNPEVRCSFCFIVDHIMKYLNYKNDLNKAEKSPTLTSIKHKIVNHYIPFIFYTPKSDPRLSATFQEILNTTTPRSTLPISSVSNNKTVKAPDTHREESQCMKRCNLLYLILTCWCCCKRTSSNT